MTIPEGDPYEFLRDLRETLRDSDETEEHYSVVEALAIEPLRDEDKQDKPSDEQVAGSDELEAFVAEGARLTRAFVLLSAISGVLAAAGLLRDSPAVVVGSMVLAPLFKPILLIGIAVALGKPRRALRGAAWLATSLAISAVAALLTALLTPDRGITSLIELRSGISPFDVVVALAAGIAMGYVLIKRDSVAMVGIVVAASLMPVAATLGITVTLGRFDLVGGAAFTLASNVCGILFGLIVSLRFEDALAAEQKRRRIADWVLKWSLAYGSIALAALTGFGVWTYLSVRETESEATGFLDRHRDVVLGSTKAADGSTLVFVSARTIAEGRFEDEAVPSGVLLVTAIAEDCASE